MKKNCWEHMNCGREPGGKWVDKFGICPTSQESILDGIHGGVNAGRSCWAASKAGQAGDQHASCRVEAGQCESCDFFQMVQREESVKFIAFPVLQNILKWK